jgi:hypothetical protein
MTMMSKAGFDSVFIGIELPDENSLTECQKTHNKNRDLLTDVQKIHRSGLQVMGGFIVGFDSDTPSIFQRQIDFIQRSGIVTAMVGMLQAAPGTRLFERLAREQRVSSSFSGDNVDGRTNIVPTMGLDNLIDGYRSIMKQIYSPSKYYQRIRCILRELKTPTASIPTDSTRLFAFLRACLRLGILGKERFQYWYLLMWALVRRPKLLPLAVTLAIYGYHYRKICELYILWKPGMGVMLRSSLSATSIRLAESERFSAMFATFRNAKYLKRAISELNPNSNRLKKWPLWRHWTAG